MRKSNPIRQKSKLTYSVSRKSEQEIREYVDSTKEKTGVSKERIVSDLLIESIHRAKKNCS